MTNIYGGFFFSWASCNLTKTTISVRFPLKRRNSRSRWGIRHIHGPFPREINLGSVGVLTAAAANERWPSPLAEKDPPRPGFGRASRLWDSRGAAERPAPGAPGDGRKSKQAPAGADSIGEPKRGKSGACGQCISGPP